MIGTATAWQPLAPGVSGTSQTLRVMRGNVTDAVLDPHQLTRRCACAILEDAGSSGDRVESCRALFNWIAGNVVFRRDPHGTEQPIPPILLLMQAEEFAASKGKANRPVADCKSQASLMGALGFSVGMPMVWVVIGPSPVEFTHVYAALQIVPGATGNASLLALDAATTAPVFGVPSDMHGGRWVVPAINDF